VLGPHLLHQAQHGVHREDRSDDHRVGDVADESSDDGGRGEQRRERVEELVGQTGDERSASYLVEPVRADLGASLLDLLVGEAEVRITDEGVNRLGPRRIGE
jgi:hypothetical protein